MVTRYVNTASAGGNGTTNAISGANAAYATLNAAELALRALNAADNLEILCCGVAPDTMTAQFSAFPYVQAGFGVAIRANRGDPAGFHGGRWNANRYHMQTAVNAFCLSIHTVPVPFEIDGLQMRSNTAGMQAVQNGGAPLVDVIFRNCLFDVGAACSSPVSHSTASGSVKYVNCVFNGVGNTYALFLSPGGTAYVYNCVVQGCARGVNLYSGTAVVKNCAVFNNGDDFASAGVLTVDHCASDDGDGTNPIAIPSWLAEYADASYAANVNYRLRFGAVQFGAGVGPAGDPVVPADDMIAFPRAGAAASCGPFETYCGVTQLDYRFLRSRPSLGLVDAADGLHSVQAP